MPLLPRSLQFNDPFPMVLRRAAHAVAPKVFRDPFEEFERKVFDEMVGDKRPERAAPTKSWRPTAGVWYEGNPPVPGDYIASKSRDATVKRHWNGSFWSLPWGGDLKASRDRQANTPATKNVHKILWQVLR